MSVVDTATGENPSHAKRNDLRIKFAAKNEMRRRYYQPGNSAHQRARELRRRVGGAFGRERNTGDLMIGTSAGARPQSTQEAPE